MNIIYKVTNTINDKAHVGKTTKSLEQRWKEHCNAAERGDQTYFYSAVRKYRPESFKVEILEVIRSGNHLDHAERHWIKRLKTYFSEFGYNLTFGGDGGKLNEVSRRKLSLSHLGKSPSLETRRKLSLVQKGRVISEEARRKMRRAWEKRRLIPVSLETRRKLSLISKGRPQSLATRLKKSLSLKGRTFSAERCHNISLARKGQVRSLESRQQQSLARKGKPWSAARRLTFIRNGLVFSLEHRNKLSLARLGCKHSEESRRKMSEAKKGKPWSVARRSSSQEQACTTN